MSVCTLSYVKIWPYTLRTFWHTPQRSCYSTHTLQSLVESRILKPPYDAYNTPDFWTCAGDIYLFLLIFSTCYMVHIIRMYIQYQLSTYLPQPSTIFICSRYAHLLLPHYFLPESISSPHHVYGLVERVRWIPPQIWTYNLAGMGLFLTCVFSSFIPIIMNTIRTSISCIRTKTPLLSSLQLLLQYNPSDVVIAPQH